MQSNSAPVFANAKTVAAQRMTLKTPALPSIWLLGIVSMLTDISSEMVHSLLPMFLITSMGASVLVVGLIEGLAEFTAMMLKIFLAL
jgi:hypothetical protein